MFRRSHGHTRTLLFVAILISLAVEIEAFAQVPNKPRLGMAEVTANDVYVRSGPSSNHYPMLKLSAGGRVTVVGERGQWYEIVPPQGAFSFIHGDYVDTADDKHGVVNGDNVRVRAGSSLPKFDKMKYTIQTKLSKGAQVVILQREPEGFLRIAPPSGVTLWINRGFVAFVPDGLLRLEGEMKKSTATDGGESPSLQGENHHAVGSAADDSASEDPTVLGGVPLTEQRQALETLDAAVRAELEKPFLERQFAELVEPYRAIAAQDEDEFAQRYARGRIEQITNMATLIDTVRKMRDLGSEADAGRRQFLEGRAKIGASLPPIPTGIEVQGELRVSAVYPPGSTVQRYRLVRSTGTDERTIGYVEIPPDADIDVDVFLGRYVGVRASGKRLQIGGVDPIPVYIAKELILLQPTPAAGESAPGD